MRAIQSQAEPVRCLAIHPAGCILVMYPETDVLATIICIFLSGAVRTQAAPSEISCKYYTSIEVQSGDTLWSIASDHITEEYRDMNAYIDEVCSINKISQNEIHAGQYLTIPYYSSIAIAGQ